MNAPTSDEKAKRCCATEHTGNACCQPAAGNVASGCAPGEAPCKKTKVLIGVIIILAAIAVGAYSLVRGASAQANKIGPAQSFSASLSEKPAAPIDGADKAKSIPQRQEISLTPLESLQSLDTLAADKDVVFIVLPSGAQIPSRAFPKQVETVVNNLLNSGQKIGVFTLKGATPDYEKLVRHFSVKSFPGVVILGRQGSAQAVSGDISEALLYNAFVLASKPVACCPTPSSAACCPK